MHPEQHACARCNETIAHLIGCHVVCCQPRGDFGCLFPARGINLVPAKMDHVLREKSRRLAGRTSFSASHFAFAMQLAHANRQTRGQFVQEKRKESSQDPTTSATRNNPPKRSSMSSNVALLATFSGCWQVADGQISGYPAHQAAACPSATQKHQQTMMLVRHIIFQNPIKNTPP